MEVQNKIYHEQIAQHLSVNTSKRAGSFVLCSFTHAQDLLFGIAAIKSFNIPICEVYSPIPIEGLRSKLEINRLKTGNGFLKYGFIGGLSLSSIIPYVLSHSWSEALSSKGIISIAMALVFMFFAFVMASKLLMVKPPSIIKLPSPDSRFLIVVKTRNIIRDGGVASFLQYSGAVEITQAVKTMLLT